MPRLDKLHSAIQNCYEIIDPEIMGMCQNCHTNDDCQKIETERKKSAKFNTL